ncbi:MAG: hypothetical protein CVV02_05010 [Firmicutes bacterium HGW-Firmicutes-7]|nr:MAG: hypothetical protein CVV02_05010 [Firmicutes bacterium HGW-Firmicutes-7]
MKKTIVLFLTFSLFATLLVGCGKKEDTTTVTPEVGTETPVETPETPEDGEAVDVVTTASLVDNGEALVQALSAEGTWIASTLNDITLTEDLVVEGEFMNKEVVARKIAPYTQDEERNITASFTITAPKLIVKSENTKLQGGTFVGDVYVEANGFTVSAATVEGNVYFSTQEFMDSAVFDETGIVTGAKEVQ